LTTINTISKNKPRCARRNEIKNIEEHAEHDLFVCN
jgi:hypothetical protein